MDRSAPFPSSASGDPLCEAELGDWVERALGALDRVQAMTEEVIAAVTAQIRRGGGRMGPLTRGLAQLGRAMRLCIALGVRLRQQALAWRRGEFAAPAAVKAARPAAVVAAPATDAAKALVVACVAGTALAAAQPGLKPKVAALYDRVGRDELGDELGGRSDAAIYREICRLLGVTPDPELFGAVAAAPPEEEAGAVAPAGQAACDGVRAGVSAGAETERAHTALADAAAAVAQAQADLDGEGDDE